MNIPQQIAKHVRAVFFGGNWTESTLKDHLMNVDWKQATTQVYTFNTIATLVFHINYYVVVQLKVLRGESLDGMDKNSFNHAPILSAENWEMLVNKTFADAEDLATLVEQLPANALDEIFIDEKYGNYFRNFQGLVEHTHYHLGQIVLIKKMVEANKIA